MTRTTAVNAYSKLGDAIIWDEMSPEQLWILEQRAIGISVHQICTKWKEKFNKETELGRSVFKTCILHCAFGLNWQPSLSTGQYPYLCDRDLLKLEEFVEKKAEDGDEATVTEVLNEAKNLKIQRNDKAVQVLSKLGHHKLFDDLSKIAVKAPCRSWLNKIAALTDIKTINLEFLDQDRYYACHREVIEEFYNSFETEINRRNPALLFGADETMLKPNPNKKVVVPIEMEAALRQTVDELPHISAMCAHNVIGASPPLFIILKHLQNLPSELKRFADEGSAWFASSTKGYMTRELFLIWSINFINWLSSYRLTLSPEIRFERALLIMDGHFSRECPMAISLFDQHNIDVLILLSHCTHVLQMFDVVLANVMKTKFSDVFSELLLDDSLSFPSKIARIRFALVSGAISGWDEACTRKNCLAAAEKTGIFPFSLQRALESKYVRELTEKEMEVYLARKNYAERHFVCSGKMLTTPEVIIEMVNHLKQRPHLSHLYSPVLVHNTVASYIDIARYFSLFEKNGSKSISRFQPFHQIDKPPVCFE